MTVSGKKNRTGKRIKTPINRVIKNIPFGDPNRESAIAPITGAIIGAMPIVAVTLESDFAA